MTKSSSVPRVSNELLGHPEFERFCERVFSSLPRKDQQRKAAAYVAGLILARGRKSFRNIAGAAASGDVNEQSLHHFVSVSTWSWRSVRKALAQEAATAQPVHAFVAGHRDLAPVTRWALPGSGRREAEPRGSRVYGLWATSDRLCLPIAWSLDPGGHREPDRPSPSRSPEDTLVEAHQDARPASGAHVPLVADARELDVARLLRRLGPTAPAVLRIRPDQAVIAGKPGTAVTSVLPVPAQQIAWRNRHLRRAVTLRGRGGDGPVRLAVSSLPVLVPDRERPGRPAAEPIPAELLSVGEAQQPWPRRVWLLTGATADMDLNLYHTSLLDDVGVATEEACDAFGLGDYRGRSAEGFHRHATLVGVAQAYAAVHDRPAPTASAPVTPRPAVRPRLRPAAPLTRAACAAGGRRLGWAR